MIRGPSGQSLGATHILLGCFSLRLIKIGQPMRRFLSLITLMASQWGVQLNFAWVTFTVRTLLLDRKSL